MKTFRTSIRIHAPAETIWQLLVDGARWNEWNSTVVEVTGKIALGERVTVRPKINPNRAFPVKVAEMQRPERMVWTGGMPLGLFKGERTFTLTPQSDGSVEFSMIEVFSGLMAPLIQGSIPDMQPAFDDFGRDLKRRAEA